VKAKRAKIQLAVMNSAVVQKEKWNDAAKETSPILAKEF
jgi:hypothetical protein